MIRHNTATDCKSIVVIGHGMVGHRFCERLVEYDTQRRYRIVTFCEEPRAAYDRVGLTQFFAHRDAQKLMLANIDWYKDYGIELHIGDRATAIDRQRRIVQSEKGVSIAYDAVVLATGSYPFVPPIPGVKNMGVFVYRTIEDLEQIIAYSRHARRAAVIGGGLRPGRRDAHCRVRAAAHAATGGRCRLEAAGAQDRRTGRARSPQQGDKAGAGRGKSRRVGVC
jgi:NAD(P)H-nitrite reductase large subunit